MDELLAAFSLSKGRVAHLEGVPYIKELGFFFFLRMAVEVSSSC
jgi:hypothetical protein